MQLLQFIVAHVPIVTANKLLHANFYVYQHKDVHGKQFLRTEAFTMPEDIKDHIDFIGETVQFPSFSKRVSGPVINAFTPKVNKSVSGGRIINGYVTPELINKVYNIDDNDVKSPESTQSLFEALGQNFCPADLALFQQEMGLALSPVQKGWFTCDSHQLLNNSHIFSYWSESRGSLCEEPGSVW